MKVSFIAKRLAQPDRRENGADESELRNGSSQFLDGVGNGSGIKAIPLSRLCGSVKVSYKKLL